ncbi:MAG: mitofilin family membrane protein [Alphaproteobacteria bacterium]|nr:mitofilin family membrane protein [Alphaproteobacteria bacterium]
MVKASKPRHSRTTRKPVTIDLEPDAVSDDKSADKPADKAATKANASTSTTKAAARATGPKTGKTAAPKDDAKPAVTDSPQAKSTPQTKADTTTKEPANAGAKAAEDKASPAPTSEPPQPQQSGSAMKSLGIALVAAIVAVALVVGLQWTGILPAPGAGTSGSDVLSEDVNALKQSVAALQSDVAAAGSDIGQALESRIDALESATGSSTGLGDVEKRFEALESKVTAMASQSGDTDGASNTQALTGLNEKLAAVESAQTQQQTALQGIDGKLSDLDSKITADEASQDQAIKAIEDRLSAIEKTLDAPRQDVQVARALAAASLKAAIDRGGSFMAELEAFASVDGNSASLDQLRTLAASGVPSRATLLTRFPTVANSMIDAGIEGDGSGGVIDRLLTSATSLVKVRPVGDVSGDSVEAIVARMETRLKNGDLQGAVDEWNTLPEASKTASQAYVKDLQARIEAEKLVSTALTAALPESTTSTDAASGDSADAPQSGEQN